MYVVTVDLSLEKPLKQYLTDHHFEFSFPPYTFFQAKKKGISCVLYTSGKLVINGKESPDFIRFHLEPHVLHSFAYDYENTQQDLQERMGIDESGKGDFFGPLCIAGVSASSQDDMKYLYSLKLKDSKLLKDSHILTLAKHIEKIPHHIITLFPEKYNRLYESFRNLNLLLAWGHATVIENLLIKTPSCPLAISDQFAKKEILENALKSKKLAIRLTQRHKAEEDVIVAAASILARKAFILGINKLETTYNLLLPKGAGVAQKKMGTSIYRNQGIEVLQQVSKKHFKTFEEILLNK